MEAGGAGAPDVRRERSAGAEFALEEVNEQDYYVDGDEAQPDGELVYNYPDAQEGGSDQVAQVRL